MHSKPYDRVSFLLHATDENSNLQEGSKVLSLTLYLTHTLTTKGARLIHPHNDNLIREPT
eukprot:7165010-Pyramimonas_sp.AAC.1